jgi:HK97 family phage portal protein
MNIFYRVGSWMMGGLSRMMGIQYGSPSNYQETSASPVTFDSAMQLSAVWACVKLISETVASLPLTVYKTTETGRKIAVNHPLNELFSRKVNRYQTKIEFFETVLLNLIVHGNAYCQIQRAGDRIIGLLPLMSSQMEVTLEKNGSVMYEYTHDGGVQVFSDKTIWHLKLMGNGIIGMSPLAHQRNTLGIAQAAESQVGKIYKNGGKPSGVLSVDKFLSVEQRDLLRKKYESLTDGDSTRFMVLEGGLKFDAVSLTPQDIELLESRRFQISEIARWYGVPSVMINDTSGGTVWGSGIEQIVAGFYKVTLRPLMEKIEASILVNLMQPNESNRHEVEFDFNALTRSDLKTRYDSYRIGIYGGFLKPNEARRMEGMEDAEGGDVLVMQGANVPLTDLDKPQGANNEAFT